MDGPEPLGPALYHHSGSDPPPPDVSPGASPLRHLPEPQVPDFRIFQGSVEFGAAWRKTSGEGRDYLSVKLDDPSFPAPIYATLVEGEQAGSYTMIWSRRQGD